MLQLEKTLAHKLSPRYRVVLFVRLSLCAVALGVMLVAVVLVLPHSWRMLAAWIAGVLGVALVDMVAGPIEQMLNLRTLKVRTAARAWSIPSLEPAVAEHLFDEIAVRARVADDGGL